jgi:23S rRNA pseudouridine2605 synthase
MRLQLFLAKCGVASRRACEKIILDGRVSVNGEIISILGTKVYTNDKILVDGKQVEIEAKKRYILLNKPAGYVCSMADEKGRLIAADLLKDTYSERLYNVGRLDMYSTGLIIFTNDGQFASTLSHPSAEIEKEYEVESSLPLPRDLAEKFCSGLRIDDIFYRAKFAKEINSHKIRITLIEGKNREIRRVFEHLGIGIRKLQRIRIGNITIDSLKESQFRELTAQEIKGLMNLCKTN